MKLCLNCNFKFERGTYCPRCNSHKVKELEVKELEKPAAGAEPQERKPMVFDKSGQRVYGDTKEAWKSFHSQVQNACPGCTGTEFTYDYRHKQKVCKKCGEILFMPRRPA
ncbi:MAG TPA: hypothetical protein VI875_02725 [Candidatus Norongarragalinales archaeon]|nr:hypothetical protein [Candidatus Norongarragalinales archaeon]